MLFVWFPLPQLKGKQVEKYSTKPSMLLCSLFLSKKAAYGGSSTVSLLQDDNNNCIEYWQGEKWLDIRSSTVKTLLEARVKVRHTPGAPLTCQQTVLYSTGQCIEHWRGEKWLDIRRLTVRTHP